MLRRAAYPPDRLGMPIALRTSAIGLAAAAGPLLGGALVTQLGWRPVFFLNVVPALLMAALALTVRDAPRAGGSAAGLDLPGAALLAVALVALVRTLVVLPATGLTTATVLGPVVATAATAAFVRHERRAASPLVPSGLLGSPTVGAALGTLVCASAALFGTLFVSTYYLQDVLGLDPLQSSLRALPLAVMMVLGAGFVAVMVSATAVVVRCASAGSAGVAGGLQQTAMNIGPTVGVAVATTLVGLAGVDMGPAPTVLAALTAIGALSALRLPGRDDAPVAERRPAGHPPGDAAREVRTRR